MERLHKGKGGSHGAAVPFLRVFNVGENVDGDDVGVICMVTWGLNRMLEAVVPFMKKLFEYLW
jgi:hypothetical protein